MMFKPYKSEDITNRLRETIMIMKDIRSDLYNETYVPHRYYLIHELEEGFNQIRYLRRQRELVKKYY